MEVVVEDLCKPDVVAAIAKRRWEIAAHRGTTFFLQDDCTNVLFLSRFFFIKDKPNLTPEIWEKFK